jgi:hypothetical protein
VFGLELLALVVALSLPVVALSLPVVALSFFVPVLGVRRRGLGEQHLAGDAGRPFLDGRGVAPPDLRAVPALPTAPTATRRRRRREVRVATLRMLAVLRLVGGGSTVTLGGELVTIAVERFAAGSR